MLSAKRMHFGQMRKIIRNINTAVSYGDSAIDNLHPNLALSTQPEHHLRLRLGGARHGIYDLVFHLENRTAPLMKS
jgi:hypothetical protein